MRKKLILVTVLAAILGGFVITDSAYAGGKKNDDNAGTLFGALVFTNAAQIAGSGGNPNDFHQRAVFAAQQVRGGFFGS